MGEIMKQEQIDLVEELNQKLPELTIEQRIELVASSQGPIVFSTSFGIEDQVLTHIISQKSYPIGLFTLDTGRLFEETYEVWEKTLTQYPIEVKSFSPEADDLKKLITEQGPNGFYQGLNQRMACCSTRKIKPLKVALHGVRVWITGLRAQQNHHRTQLTWASIDQQHDLVKVNPLLDSSEAELYQWVNKHNIPVNKLHNQGYPSIGCAPCTRAVPPGSDPRSGRWWWEQSHKECGLHLNSHS